MCAFVPAYTDPSLFPGLPLVTLKARHGFTATKSQAMLGIQSIRTAHSAGGTCADAFASFWLQIDYERTFISNQSSLAAAAHVDVPWQRRKHEHCRLFVKKRIPSHTFVFVKQRETHRSPNPLTFGLPANEWRTYGRMWTFRKFPLVLNSFSNAQCHLLSGNSKFVISHCSGGFANNLSPLMNYSSGTSLFARSLSRSFRILKVVPTMRSALMETFCASVLTKANRNKENKS